MKRITAKIGEYQKDGGTKGKYVDIGVIMSNNNGEYVLLNPNVSLSGILQQQNLLAASKQQLSKGRVIASVFDSNRQQQATQFNEPPVDFDDDIPF